MLHLTLGPTLYPSLPLLLLLNDSNQHFSSSLSPPSIQLALSTHPTLSLPTLTFDHGARGGNLTVLSEPSSIALFLEGKLSPHHQGPAFGTGSAPDARARLEQMRAFSASFLESFSVGDRPFYSPSPSLPTTFNTDPAIERVQLYLTVLEHHLQGSFFPPLLAPPLGEGRTGTTLTPAAAWIWTCIEFIQAKFPDILPSSSSGTSSPHLRDEVGHFGKEVLKGDEIKERDDKVVQGEEAREEGDGEQTPVVLEKEEQKFPHTVRIKTLMDKRPGVKKLRESQVMLDIGDVW